MACELSQIENGMKRLSLNDSKEQKESTVWSLIYDIMELCEE